MRYVKCGRVCKFGLAHQVFGRRQTFWDMVLGLLSARDKSLPVILLELVATVMVNFTVGLCVSVFAFLFQARPDALRLHVMRACVPPVCTPCLLSCPIPPLAFCVGADVRGGLSSNRNGEC